MRTYSNYYGTSAKSYQDGDIVNIINNNNAYNLNWCMRLINDALRYLTIKYFWNESSVSYYTVPGQQMYPLPAQIDKFVNMTVLIGNVLWQPAVCSSRRMWDSLNVIQFLQEFPYFYYIWGGQVGIWPTPTNSTDLITINYKKRIVELNNPDVTGLSTGATISTNVSSQIASYALSSDSYELYAGNIINVGQSFETTTADMLDSCSFALTSVGSPTGYLQAMIFAATGSSGSYVPAGSAAVTEESSLMLQAGALAVSDPIDVQEISSTTPFYFTNENKIMLLADTTYCVQIQFNGGDSSNYVTVGRGTLSLSGNANYSNAQGTGWTADSAHNLIFKVFGSPDPRRIKASLAIFAPWMELPDTNASLNIPSSVGGDNQWYAISSVNQADLTEAFLSMPYSGPPVNAVSSFTIGQIPLLMEDYQDLPLWKMGMEYYMTRIGDPVRYQYYSDLYEKGVTKLDTMFSSKGTNIAISNIDQPMVNPNLFVQSVNQTAN